MTISNKHAGLGAGAVCLVLLTGLAVDAQTVAAAEYKVYSPYVEKGETEIEARSYYNIDDNN